MVRSCLLLIFLYVKDAYSYACSSASDCNYVKCRDLASSHFGCHTVGYLNKDLTPRYWGTSYGAFGRECIYFDSANNPSRCPDCVFSCSPGQYYHDNCYCITCPVGYVCNGVTKTACAAGTYNPYQGGTACLACHGNTFSVSGVSECQNCTICSGNSSTQTWCTPTTDTICSPYQYACSNNTFETGRCGPVTNRICTTCSPACQPGYYESVRCTPSTDRNCQPCFPGFFCNGTSTIPCNSGTLITN